MNVARLFIVMLCLTHWALAAAATERVNELLEQASQSRSSNPEQFSTLLTELDSYRPEMSQDQANLLAYFQGYEAAFQGRFNEAAEIYRAVLERSEDPTLRFRVGYALVNVYSITRNWTEGLLQLTETMAQQDEIADPGIRQEGLMVAGVFYNQLEEFDLALDYTDKLFAEDLLPRNRCVAHQLRIEAQLNLGRLNHDANEVSEGIAACQEIGELVVANIIRLNLAQLHIESGQYEAAHQALSSHIDEIDGTGYKRLMAEAYALLSQARFGLGDQTQSADYARQALEHAEGFMISEPTVQAYWTLKEFHREQSDYRQALIYETRYHEAKAGIQDQLADKQLAIELARLEVEKKNQQIELLSQQNQVLQLSEDLATETAAKNRLGLFLLGVICLSLAGWVYMQKRAQGKLRVLAERDELTRLNNRRHFSDCAKHLLHYCQTQRQNASFIMFDLDHFKDINDSHGHSAGDRVLQRVASVVREQSRENDLVGRIGGEEFALLLPSCDTAKGKEFAENCRRAIEAIDYQDIEIARPITASFGITSCGRSGYALEDLMRECDTALYEAKGNGRNTIASFSTTMRSALDSADGSAFRTDSRHSQFG